MTKMCDFICMRMLQERYYVSVIDLVCLAMLLSITTSVRESASAVARSDVKGTFVVVLHLLVS